MHSAFFKHGHQGCCNLEFSSSWKNLKCSVALLIASKSNSLIAHRFSAGFRYLDANATARRPFVSPCQSVAPSLIVLASVVNTVSELESKRFKVVILAMSVFRP